MMKTIIITFTFINEKGIKRTVKFPMDSKYYKDLHDLSVPKDERDRVLLDEYRWYCDEHNRKKHEVPMIQDEDGKDIEKADNSPTVLEQMIEGEETNARNTLIHNLIQKLTSKQQKAIELVYFKNMKQEAAAREMGITQPSLNGLIKYALERMKKEISKSFKKVL